MVERVLVKNFSSDPEFKSRLRRVFLKREKPLFTMNPGQDLNYHTETHLLDMLNYTGNKSPY